MAHNILFKNQQANDVINLDAEIVDCLHSLGYFAKGSTCDASSFPEELVSGADLSEWQNLTYYDKLIGDGFRVYKFEYYNGSTIRVAHFDLRRSSYGILVVMDDLTHATQLKLML